MNTGVHLSTHLITAVFSTSFSFSLYNLAGTLDQWTLQRMIQLNKPLRADKIALHPNGDMMVAHTPHDATSQLFLLDGDGKYTMELVSPDPVEGNHASRYIKGISISPQGHVYVGYTRDQRIQVFNQSGAFIRSFSTPNEGGNPSRVAFHANTTFDRNGNLLLVGNTEQGVITAHACPGGEIVGQIKYKKECRKSTMKMAVNKKQQILCHYCPMESVHSKVVAIDSVGNEVFAFTPRIDEDVSGTWVYPGGIVCDSYDNIIIALLPYETRNRGHIHKYSSTGAFLECIAKRLHCPHDLSMTHDGSTMAVANYSSVLLYTLN